MNTTKKLIFLGLLLTAFTTSAHAKCFDFNTKVTTPLHTVLYEDPSALPQDKTKEKPKEEVKKIEEKLKEHMRKDTDRRDWGKTAFGGVWAGVQGIVDAPIDQVLLKLLDHKNTSSKRISEMDVKELKDPNYFAKHSVKFVIKPFLFVTVKWEEMWGFAIADGTKEEPKKIVISYEKIDGTSHIEHLCGNMVLKKLTPTTTDVFLYEEAKATQRTVDDTVRGVSGTLSTLRTKPVTVTKN